MKQVLFFSILITLSSSFQIHRADNPKLSLTAIINHRNGNNLSLKVTLTNNTADTVKYISWNCSWQDSYSIDNDKWRILVNICSKNFQETYSIPPHQSETKILELERVFGSSKSKSSKFKIGFRFVPPSASLDSIPIKLEKLKPNTVTIWSSTI